MCSPTVIARVCEELTLSRRAVLGTIVGAVGVSALAGSRVSAQDATPSPVVPVLAGGFTSVVDLTHVWGPDFPMFPGAPQPQFDVLVTIEANGFFKYQLTLDEHTGTHMDAPAHFIVDAPTADQLPASQLVAPLAVVGIRERAATDIDAQGTVDDILAWEAEHGPLPEGAFVALDAGWDARVSDPASYLNVDDSGVPHFPGWHPDATAFLLAERTITGLGVDTVSLDYGASTDFGTHVSLLGAGKYGLENLAGLGNVPPSGATIVVGGPKHLGGSGGPVRALAFV
jgi:kynurenine formamidase